MLRDGRPIPLRLRVLAFGLGAALAASLIPSRPAASTGPAAVAPRAGQSAEPIATRSTRRRPPAPCFVANHGAWDPAVRFAVLGGPTVAWIGEDAITLRIERRAIDEADRAVGGVVRFDLGPGPATRRAVGELPLASRTTVLRGADAVGSESFGRVRIVDAWPGIDLVVRPDPDAGALGALAYDLHVRPGADLAAARVRADGVERIEVLDHGAIAFDVGLGDGSTVRLTQRAPVAWIERQGDLGEPQRSSRASRVVRLDSRTFGFAVDGWDGDGALVVDPGFTWSSYLGGGASDACRAIRAVAGSGIAIGGWAGSSNFPTTVGAYRSTGGRDAFVAMLSEDGSRVLWSTYLGGSGAEEVTTIDLAADGSIVVGGWTGSADFPVTAGVVQPVFGFGSLLSRIGDGFVARLSSDGSRLVWSTYLGRLGDDFVRAVRVLPSGDVIVAGDTNADTFPTTAGVLQPQFGSGSILVPDAFVTKLSGDATRIVWSTYFGGFAQELVNDMVVAGDGSILIAGLTASQDFRTTPGAYQTRLRNSWDGFVARISDDGRTLIASTLFGGDGYDQVRGIALDPHGDLWIAGVTATDLGPFPVSADGFQILLGAEDDGYVARLSGDLGTLRGSTLLGGSGDDSCEAVAVGPDGDVYVVGTTGSADFPVGGQASQPVYGGGVFDGFVAHLDRALTRARAVSFAGGSDKDLWTEIAVLGAADVVVAGTTWSADVPIAPGAAQPALAGGSDAVLARVALDADGSGAVRVEPRVDEDSSATFAPGTSFTLAAATLRNGTPAAVQLEAVELVIGAIGARVESLESVALWVDVDGDGVVGAADTPIGGGVPIAPGTFRLALTVGRDLDVGAELRLVVAGTTRTDCPPAAELTARIAGVVARRSTDGRRADWGRASGVDRMWIQGARREFTGDLDGDGVATCRDVRRLASRLGDAADAAGQDPDRDGRITDADVEASLGRVVGRAPLFLPADGPAPSPGGVLVVEGYDLEFGAVRATLDDRPLEVALRGPRGLWLAVPIDARRGAQTFRLFRDDVLLVEQPVLLQ